MATLLFKDEINVVLGQVDPMGIFIAIVINHPDILVIINGNPPQG